MELCEAVQNRMKSSPEEWRKGQAAFNALYELRPDLANSIRGKHVTLDPFYIDNNLPAFWDWLKEQD